MIALRLCLRALFAFIMVVNVARAETAVKSGGTDGSPSTASCVACHGAFGAGSVAGIPRLAGQNSDYLAHALSMFKERTRASDVMQGVAQNLSDSEMRELATYFSMQHPPRIQGTHIPEPELVAAGKQLAEIGAVPQVAACFSCHGANGKGDGVRFPGITGQPEAFLITRLHDFQARAKKTPPAVGSMTAISATLNDTQIRQAAAYLSTLEQYSDERNYGNGIELLRAIPSHGTIKNGSPEP
jgi:cytochrome c553